MPCLANPSACSGRVTQVLTTLLPVTTARVFLVLVSKEVHYGTLVSFSCSCLQPVMQGTKLGLDSALGGISTSQPPHTHMRCMAAGFLSPCAVPNGPYLPTPYLLASVNIVSQLDTCERQTVSRL